jgi:hypothetical protein
MPCDLLKVGGDPGPRTDRDFPFWGGFMSDPSSRHEITLRPLVHALAGAFDLALDSDGSRAVIRQVLDFLRLHLDRAHEEAAP